MLTRFLKAVPKHAIVWFVVGNTVIQGNLVTHLTDVDGEIKSVSLGNVIVRHGDAETEVENLIVPTFRVTAWGSEDKSFDHLVP